MCWLENMPLEPSQWAEGWMTQIGETWVMCTPLCHGGIYVCKKGSSLGKAEFSIVIRWKNAWLTCKINWCALYSKTLCMLSTISWNVFPSHFCLPKSKLYPFCPQSPLLFLLRFSLSTESSYPFLYRYFPFSNDLPF